MEKIFNHKSFNYFVSIPLGSRVNLLIHFCLQVQGLSSLIVFPLFAIGVIDTNGKFAPLGKAPALVVLTSPGAVQAPIL
jgi:hypothetical protein